MSLLLLAIKSNNNNKRCQLLSSTMKIIAGTAEYSSLISSSCVRRNQDTSSFLQHQHQKQHLSSALSENQLRQGVCNNAVGFRRHSSSSQNGNNGEEKKGSTEAAAAEKTDNEEWIPPNRPLSGDQGYYNPEEDDMVDPKTLIDDALFTISDDDSEKDVLRKLEEALALEEELEKQRLEKRIEMEKRLQEQKQQSLEGDSHIPNVDWMQTRRKALAEAEAECEESATKVPILEHTLLTNDEILTILEDMGGTDLETIIFDDEYGERQQVLQTDGMIFCTSPSPYQLQSLSNTLINHMRLRKLHDPPHNVGSAQINPSKSSLDIQQQQWNAIDCSNFIVHIMDERTRRDLKLEELWSGKDALWKLNIEDEDAVDDYISKNPVPMSYNGGQGYASDDISRSSTSRQLLRQAFVTAPHRPVIPSTVKQRQRSEAKRKKKMSKKNVH